MTTKKAKAAKIAKIAQANKIARKAKAAKIARKAKAAKTARKAKAAKTARKAKANKAPAAMNARVPARKKPVLPLIIVNFKAAEHAVGDAALTLALVCERVALEEKAAVAIAVQPTDLHSIASIVRRIPVLAQHVDPVGFGAHTGAMPAVIVKQAGALGTLLNHSERRLKLPVLAASIEAAHQAGLWVCACARDVNEARKIAKLGPDMIAVEPPKLIGGEVSVSTASPGVIKQATSAVKRMPVLVGAGVKSQQDVRIALKLGAKGVLVASHVTNADNPAGVLRDLIAGMNKRK